MGNVGFQGEMHTNQILEHNPFKHQASKRVTKLWGESTHLVAEGHQIAEAAHRGARGVLLPPEGQHHGAAAVALVDLVHAKLLHSGQGLVPHTRRSHLRLGAALVPQRDSLHKPLHPRSNLSTCNCECTDHPFPIDPITTHKILLSGHALRQPRDMCVRR